MGGFTKIPKLSVGDLGEEGEGDRIALFDEEGRLVGWKPNAETGGSVNNSYSTTETLTGGTWIDGKPIYRIVFIHDISYEGNISLTSLNVEKVVYINSKINYSPSSLSIRELPIFIFNILQGGNFRRGSFEALVVYDDYPQIQIFNSYQILSPDGSVLETQRYSTSGNLEIILEYTKTTDPTP